MDALDLFFAACYCTYGLCAIGIIYNVHKYGAAQEAEREKARAKAAREEEKARKAAEKEAMAAEKAAQDAEQAAQPKRPRGRPRKERPEQGDAQPAQPKRPRGRPRKEPQAMAEQEPVPAAEQDPEPEEERCPIIPEAPAWIAPQGNNAFAGQVVAFTGTLPDMTREEAIAAVQKNGGRAFDTMPAGTTLLVVGDKPGAGKLENADRWAVKKIDAQDFWTMLHTPLTLTPDEFAAFIMARLNTHNAKEA